MFPEIDTAHVTLALGFTIGFLVCQAIVGAAPIIGVLLGYTTPAAISEFAWIVMHALLFATFVLPIVTFAIWFASLDVELQDLIQGGEV